MKKIKTKYVLFCSDDDFLNFKAIFKAKKTLEKQIYISAITGRYISFQGYNKFNRIFTHPSGLSFMYDKKCVFYKNKSYTDKVYNKAIDDMIKDKDR